MGELLEIAKAVASGPNGVVLVLVLLLGLALWAYWQERKENRRLQDERLKEAREDTELMTQALAEATHTVNDFKASNEALRIAFETFTRTSRPGS